MKQFFKIMAMTAGMLAAAQAYAGEEITIVASGDIEWSGIKLNTSAFTFYDNGGVSLIDGGWQPVPVLLTQEKIARLEQEQDPILMRFVKDLERKYGANLTQVGQVYVKLKMHDVWSQEGVDLSLYPLEKVASVFKEADIAFVNLEAPMSDDAYRVGSFRMKTDFTRGLQMAGIDIISLANNHMMDSERMGMFDTIDALDKAGIAHTGAGKNLEMATKPVIIERDGIKVGFLAYTQYENSGTFSFANETRSGVAGLDPDLIKANIAALKNKVDHVLLSFHWDIYAFDITKQQDLHPEAVKFARAMIDSGADAILGHHPHVPRAIEIYKGAPIFYSLSHLIFSFNLPHWMDNYVARLKLTKDKITGIEIVPMAGTGEDLGQPYPLTGDRAKAMLENLASLSAKQNTTIKINGNIGVINIKE